MKPSSIPLQLVGAGLIPSGSANSIAAMQLDPVPPAPGLARKFVASHLVSVPVAQREAALLLTSEIVTSAVLDSGTSLEIGVGRIGGSVLLAVADRDPDVDVDPSSIGRLRGRGKILVTALADDHGTLRSSRGSTVWIVLHEHGRASAAGALDLEESRRA